MQWNLRPSQTPNSGPIYFQIHNLSDLVPFFALDHKTWAIPGFEAVSSDLILEKEYQEHIDIDDEDSLIDDFFVTKPKASYLIDLGIGEVQRGKISPYTPEDMYSDVWQDE